MRTLSAWFLLFGGMTATAVAGEGQPPPPRPSSFETQVQRVRTLLETEQPRLALQLAEVLHNQAPDNLDVYSLLVDSYRGVGQKAKALEAAQWMLDLRPTDTRGLSQAAALREDHDDLEGAIQLWNECYHRTPPGDTLARAGFLENLARVFTRLDKLEDARQLNAEAERLRVRR